MLLLLKTNDLLRGIETSLETRNSSSSFIHMTKCCIKLINSYERKQRPIRAVKEAQEIHSFLKTIEFYVYSVLKENISLLKVFFYEFFLYLAIL